MSGRITRLAAAGMMLALPAAAQDVGTRITLDGSLGSLGAVEITRNAEGAYAIGEAHGSRAGTNLFHSFQFFSIGFGDTAHFTADLETANVIARITGGEVSGIRGRIRSTLPGANVYLLNPRGFDFDGAILDIDGSFHASTAESLRFDDGVVFDAKGAGPVSLSLGTPESFGFLGDASARIRVRGTLENLGGIDLRAGSIEVRGAFNTTEFDRDSGDVHVEATEGIRFTASDIDTGTRVGSTGKGGSVVIRADAIEFVNSRVLAATRGAGRGGDVHIAASGQVYLTAEPLSEQVVIQTSSLREGSSGHAGSILIEAPVVEIRNGVVEAATVGTGDAGDIGITATDRILLGASEDGAGPGAFLNSSAVRLFDASPEPTGSAGAISIVGGDVEVAEGSVLRAHTDGSGSGGEITILADGHVDLTGTMPVDPQPVLDTSTFGSGAAGPIRIEADSLRVDETIVYSGTAGDGDAGSITVAARERVDLSGTPMVEEILGIKFETNPGLDARAANGSLGDGGDVRVWAPVIRVSEGGGIFSGTSFGSQGTAGEIEVTADVLEVVDRGQIRSNTGPGSTGDAGDLTLRVGELRVRDGARVTPLTTGQGDGGILRIEASRLVDVSGLELVAVTDPGILPGSQLASQGHGLFTSTTGIALETPNAGSAGDLIITAPLLRVHDSGNVISASVFSSGSAGNIILDVNRLVVESGGLIDSSVGVGGAAGDVIVNASESVEVRGASAGGIPSRVRAFSVGEADAGSVRISAPRVELDGGSVLTSNFGLLTKVATRSVPGSAGEVVVDADVLEMRSGGLIDSSTFGAGAGGNVSIRTAGATVVSGSESRIQSETLGNGAGGVVQVDAGEIRVENGGTISSRAGSGSPGVREALEDGVRLFGVAIQDLLPDGVDGLFDDAPDAGGDGGRIEVESAGRVTLDAGSIRSDSISLGDAGDVRIRAGGAVLLQDASISTEATRASGGGIELETASLLELRGSSISTSVTDGSGGGGDLALTAEAIVLDASEVSARAETGDGGNITITAGSFIASPDSIVSASSRLGIDGRIAIRSPQTDLQGELAALPANFLDPSSLLVASCAARLREGREGSLVVAQRRGLHASPEELLVAFHAPRSAPGALPAVAAAGPTRGGPASSPEPATALLARGQAQQAEGQFVASLETLRAAVELAERDADPEQLALALGFLGNAHVALAEPEKAQALLDRSLALVEGTRRPALGAVLWNNLGNHHAARGDQSGALAAYERGATLAGGGVAPIQEAKALANGARAALEAGEHPRASVLLERAGERVALLPPSRDRVFLQVHLAKSYEQRAAALPAVREASLLAAWDALGDASQLAERLGDERTLAFAIGNLGALYQRENRLDEALYLTRRALRAAEQAGADESLYRWHWQEGQLLWAKGQPNPAVRAYRRAVDILQETRQETLLRYGSSEVYFRRAVAPVYLELVSALLRASDWIDDPAEVQQLLVEARATVEDLKAAELRNYFRDSCVAELAARRVRVESVSAHSAIVYPIVLPDRLELLVSLPGGVRRFEVPVPQPELEAEIGRFRRTLETRTTQQHRGPGRKLYDWLVRPYAGELAAAEVETLVFVPDGLLRTIPMAALSDGDEFLVRRYGVAVTPTLALQDPQPLDLENPTLLLAGLSEPVQGFPALSRVPAELSAIRELYGGEVLLDDGFTLERVESELAQAKSSIVHIASHGQFTGDPRSSFLLTYDGRLSVDRIREVVGAGRFGDQPLELLVLSACRTAAGDERAALGLAGAAIQAGARSVVGSLWYIDDEAAAALLGEFYRQLREPGVSKAQALRRAQTALIADARFGHPYYWSPFLLLNNWL